MAWAAFSDYKAECKWRTICDFGLPDSRWGTVERNRQAVSYPVSTTDGIRKGLISSLLSFHSPRMPNADRDLLEALIALTGVLTVGSIARLIFAFGRSNRATTTERLRSLATWWTLWLAVVAATLAGKVGVALLLGAASALGLWEYCRLAEKSGREGPIWLSAFVLGGLHYWICYGQPGGWFWLWLPAGGFFWLLLVNFATSGRTPFPRTALVAHLGLMLIVFGLSHGLLLVDRGEKMPAAAGGFGIFLYVLFLTEINDISQAVFGRALGRHKITPRVSPNKTWEGFVAGLVVTAFATAILAPWLLPPWPATAVISGVSIADDGPLTDLSSGGYGGYNGYLVAAALGLMIAGSGFIGDITMSAIKRAYGVKDSGTLLPGQGGVLDRIDSFTFSAPTVYYLLPFLYG